MCTNKTLDFLWDCIRLYIVEINVTQTGDMIMNKCQRGMFPFICSCCGHSQMVKVDQEANFTTFVCNECGFDNELCQEEVEEVLDKQ